MKPVTKDELSTQYMPWYVRDYLEDHDILVLSCAAEGARARLVTVQWLKGILPASPDVLRVLTRASTEEWPAIWAQLESHFPLADDAPGRRNPGVHALYLERMAYLQTKRANGAKGGRPKADEKRPDNRKGNRSDNQPDNHSDNRQDSRPDNQADSHSVNHQLNHALNHPGNRSETGSEPQPNQSETVVVGVVDKPLSPPPSGGGSFPAPPQPGGLLSADAQLDGMLHDVPDADARQAIARLLHEQQIPPLRWARWIERCHEWVKGKGTPGNRPMPWPAIALGIAELLDVNPEGQRITPESLVQWAARVQHRIEEPAASWRGTAADNAFDVDTSHDAMRALARREAAAGDPEWQAYCADNGIPFAEEVA